MTMVVVCCNADDIHSADIVMYLLCIVYLQFCLFIYHILYIIYHKVSVFFRLFVDQAFFL